MAGASLDTAAPSDRVEVVATRFRSWDRGQQSEERDHVSALVDANARARKHRRLGRLAAAAPSANAFLRRLHRPGGLFGLLASWNAFADKPRIADLPRIEDDERRRSSLARRLCSARIGAFEPIADFDWT